MPVGSFQTYLATHSKKVKMIVPFGCTVHFDAALNCWVAWHSLPHHGDVINAIYFVVPQACVEHLLFASLQFSTPVERILDAIKDTNLLVVNRFGSSVVLKAPFFRVQNMKLPLPALVTQKGVNLCFSHNPGDITMLVQFTHYDDCVLHFLCTRKITLQVVRLGVRSHIIFQHGEGRVTVISGQEDNDIPSVVAKGVKWPYSPLVPWECQKNCIRAMVSKDKNAKQSLIAAMITYGRPKRVIDNLCPTTEGKSEGECNTPYTDTYACSMHFDADVQCWFACHTLERNRHFVNSVYFVVPIADVSRVLFATLQLSSRDLLDAVTHEGIQQVATFGSTAVLKVNFFSVPDMQFPVALAPFSCITVNLCFTGPQSPGDVMTIIQSSQYDREAMQDLVWSKVLLHVERLGVSSQIGFDKGICFLPVVTGKERDDIPYVSHGGQKAQPLVPAAIESESCQDSDIDNVFIDNLPSAVRAIYGKGHYWPESVRP